MLRFYLGRTGSGKTYLAVLEALRSVKKRLKKNRLLLNQPVHFASNVEIRHPLVSKIYDFKDHQIFKEEHGVLLIDEMGLAVNARSYAANSQESLDFAILNRKQDIFAHCTVQSLKYVDSMYREQDFEIWIPSRCGFPLLGLLFPWTKVKTKHCSCGAVPWDVVPDDRGWRKWFGFGTFFWVRVFRLSDLANDGRVASAQAGVRSSAPEGYAVSRPPAPRKYLIRFYDQAIADLYDTHSKPKRD